MTISLVYTLIRAKPFFDTYITNAHNPSDQETIEFFCEITRFRNYDFFLYQLLTYKIVPKLKKCLEWVMF